MIELLLAAEQCAMAWNRTAAYQAQVEFFEAMAAFLDYGPDAELRARQAVAQLECRGRAVAESGMRSAVADMVQISLSWDRERRAEVDEALNSRGVLTSTQAERIIISNISNAMRIGRISNDEEYGEFQAILEDDNIPESLRDEMQAMVDRYAFD